MRDVVANSGISRNNGSPRSGCEGDTSATEAVLAALSMERSPRMDELPHTDASSGSVHWQPKKSFWYTVMALGAVVFAPYFVTTGAVLLFLATTATTICFGHSIGMHRKLIHQSFSCPLWLEHIFVYLGTLVGMAGPTGMIRQHDIRDWAQRKPECHAFLAHRNSIFKDFWWQLHCDLTLTQPPTLKIEAKVSEDTLYRALDRSVMLQQVPWAILFFLLGGVPWVLWGICMRIFLSLTGHWLIGYFAHNRGQQNWRLRGAGVQGYNLRAASLLTMGESLHNNHHAFPGSARLAHAPGETDPGWWALRALERLGLVWGLNTPDSLPERLGLERVSNSGD